MDINLKLSLLCDILTFALFYFVLVLAAKTKLKLNKLQLAMETCAILFLGYE